ncbi:MAG: acyl carrier protein [Rhodocyclaceae bacterium]|nr:acyl carrier protein [Rhodocyclaceae bacterium]
MTVEDDVLRLLDDVLGLAGRTRGFTADTPLLGALPELDSMAVVGLLTALEERFGLSIADDEIDASLFATVGSFTRFVQARLDA